MESRHEFDYNYYEAENYLASGLCIKRPRVRNVTIFEVALKFYIRLKRKKGFLHLVCCPSTQHNEPDHCSNRSAKASMSHCKSARVIAVTWPEQDSTSQVPNYIHGWREVNRETVLPKNTTREWGGEGRGAAERGRRIFLLASCLFRWWSRHP